VTSTLVATDADDHDRERLVGEILAALLRPGAELVATLGFVPCR
jgi:hypothetical protein